MNKYNLNIIYTESKKIAQRNMLNINDNVLQLYFSEAIAIAMYTYDLSLMNINNEINFYQELNNYIHNLKSYNDFNPAIKSYIYYLIKGAKKLISPSTQTVYRCINTTDSIIDSYESQKKVLWKPFTSTSSDINIAKKFGYCKNNSILFEIKTTNGCDISHYSSIKNEKEILLLPGLEFVITSSQTNINGAK
jgi:hypothetical protein